MRFVTNSLEHRIAQVKRELEIARERRSQSTDANSVKELDKAIVRNEAVLRLLKKTQRLLRQTGQG